MSRLILVLALVLSTVLIPRPAEAPTVQLQPVAFGCKWHKDIVRVRVPSGWSRWNIARDFRVWNSVQRGQPHFKRVYSDADVVVHTVDRPGVNWNGNTTYICQGVGPHFTHIDIQLNVGHRQGFAERTFVALHELGHALGLDHTSIYTYAVMCPSVRCYPWWRGSWPTRHDRRALGRLY